MITKNATSCCALTILSIDDYETQWDIRKFVENLKNEAFKKDWKKAQIAGGQRNIMVVCTPAEQRLQQNLTDLGFKLLTDSMTRRNGYPEGSLRLYMLTF